MIFKLIRKSTGYSIFSKRMNLSKDKMEVFYRYCNFLPLKQTYKDFLFASAITYLVFRTVVKYRKTDYARCCSQSDCRKR